ncbi:uncharacterized protein [Rutidosis leptorrhynchoides]|uniref:uncharacterized protein n=1 Tax=Rutidosis leptorrhynchoides TaxID=125765 RepID=UPI003A9A624F
MVDGTWIVDPIVIKNKFFDYYKEKFDKVDSGADFISIEPHYVISNSESAFIERDVDDEEIKRVVWDCGSSKAPGPDGFSFQFMKEFWDLFHSDICRDIRIFFATSELPRGSNSAFFSLILKVKNPSAFISGKQILDGRMMLSEIMAWELQHIIRVLEVFYLVSGLRINVVKSHIFGIGVDETEVASLANELGCYAGSFPTKYLAVPIGANMKRVSNWESLVVKYRTRLL